MLPNLPTHERQRIAERRFGLMIPSRLSDGQLAPPGMLMRDERDQREQRQQRGRRAQDGQVRPLTLGLHAQVFANFMN